MERGLLGLAHALDNRREGEKLRPNQPDDKVVVVLVQPMTDKPDVIAQFRLALGAANPAVLHQDHVLLLRAQLLKRPGAAQRIPDNPGQGRVQGAAHRPSDQSLL